MWKVAKALLTVQYAYMLEYRAELILWVLSGSLPIILMGVWNQAAAGGQFGLSSLEFTRYFLAVFIIRQFTIVWVIWDVEREVVEGRLSPRLLQPLDPVWHYLAGHLSERLARLPFSLGLIGLFLLLYPQAFWIPSLGQFLGFVLTVILAFVLRFLLSYTMAMLCFWTERASALEELFFLFYLFLSGMIAPLTVYPSVMQEWLFWTPFPYLIYLPASILTGIPIDLGRSAVMLVVWIGGVGILNRWLWRLGLKRYSGMGA